MTVSGNTTCPRARASEMCKCDFYLHMVHHHFVGQVGPELSFVDFLVEQRLEKQTSYYRDNTTNSLVITVTDKWLLHDVQFSYSTSSSPAKNSFLLLLFLYLLG